MLGHLHLAVRQLQQFCHYSHRAGIYPQKLMVLLLIL
jgi:hypothetical protein